MEKNLKYIINIRENIHRRVELELSHQERMQITHVQGLKECQKQKHPDIKHQ